MTYRAEVERDAVQFGAGYVLRVMRCGPTGAGLELASQMWTPTEDGQLSGTYISDADAGGDLMGFLQAVMDASWRAGVRPASFCVDDTAHAAVIESQKQNIADLRRQVVAQQTMIEKLLGK